MKRFRIIITIVLTLLIGVGWVSQIGNSLSAKDDYKEYIQSGNEFYDKALYQKAIESYTQASKINHTDEVEMKMLAAYECSVAEGTTDMSDYAEALLEICNAKPKNVQNWKKLIELYMNHDDYTNAYSVVAKCRNIGIEDEELEVLMNKVSYSYSVKQRAFSEVYMSVNGYYTVCYEDKWGVLDSDGEEFRDCEYEFISPINKEGISLLVSTVGSKVVDGENVVQALITEKFEKVNSFGANLLPVQKEENVWQYYSCTEDKYVLKEYEYASAFIDGQAAIKQNGKWNIINNTGELCGEESFDDIKCMDDGTYIYSGVMLASQNGIYSIYDSNKVIESEAIIKDFDVYLGDYIAYMDENGKWGFVNEKGEIVIEPQFENAKSFSNGLAAVCKDNLWGFVNKKGDLVIEYQFLDTKYFTEGGICAVSVVEGKYQMIQLRFN